MTATGATGRIKSQLGLDDAELCDTLGLTPTELLSGDGDLLPPTQVLDALLREHSELISGDALRRWVRASGPAGRPLDHLLARNYGAFERALETLSERGFVVRRRD